MKINFLKFKEKKVFKKGSSVINPTPYWDAVLLLTALIVISSFVFSFFIFRKVNIEVVPNPEDAEAEVSALPKERIGKVLEYFKEREKKSAEIINSPSPVIDPSL
ncbi:MAG: hypothetical protein Q8O46_04165 [bacterium]|nr:hypothetical protein [bacterium]